MSDGRGTWQRMKLLLAGVGGQGVMTATRVLGEAIRASDQPVLVGQLHGMAQRGGAVQGYLVIGPGRTAFVGPGEADVVLGFEPLEAERAIPAMSDRTRVVVNTEPVVPFVLTQQGRRYPSLDAILENIRKVTSHVSVLDGSTLADRAGDRRTLSIVMLGALAGSGALALDSEALLAAAGSRSEELATANRRAFALGVEAMQQLDTGRGSQRPDPPEQETGEHR